MDKKTNKEVADVKSDAAFEMPKMVKAYCLEKMGRPSSPPLPPGTVIAAAKTIVTMSAATIVYEFAVSFNHCSPASFKSMCSSVNTMSGVLSSLFVDDKMYGGAIFFTSCTINHVSFNIKFINRDSTTLTKLVELFA